jgi:hypothetical protein
MFHWGAVALVALAFVFVAGAMWTSNLIRERDAAVVTRVEAELAGLRGARAPSGGAPAGRAAPAPPRTIDASTRTVLLEALRQVEPDGPLELRAVSSGSSEPGAFARQLAAVLEEAGWSLAGEGGGSTFGVPPVGLLIRVSDRGDVPRRAPALQEALNRAGLSVSLERVADMREGVVELMVGLQP